MAEYEKNEIIFQQLTQLLHQMKFGSITLVVQDGRVIQIEKVEKVRLK
nr:YezD family protein [uncultured Bacillus sp.]